MLLSKEEFMEIKTELVEGVYDTVYLLYRGVWNDKNSVLKSSFDLSDRIEFY